jgi:two-component sensor histidine kinase
VLLNEIRHRVGSNLQVIYGMLNMQSEYVKDRKSIDILKGCQNQIMAISLVYKSLLRSRDMANIDIQDYIDKLAWKIFNTNGIDRSRIALNIDVQKISLNIEKAIICGLIINELVSNSIEHAFPNGREGEIRIEISSIDNDIYKLTVSDNGIGLPQDLDFRNTDTFGFKTLISYENYGSWGEFMLKRDNGTEFSITF